MQGIQEHLNRGDLRLSVPAKTPGVNISGRSLIHIPVIHTQADMGALSQPIKEMTIQKLGQAGWERNVSLIDGIWERIEKEIDGWTLPYEKLRLYQDGLPVCGREVEIVTELAQAGSRNHRLLLRLMKRGATVVGTESAPLLVQEYSLVKKVLDASVSKKALRCEARYKTLSNALLKQRDQAIAERINDSLGPGETGLLFLGMLHSLGGLLAKDIRVTYPFFSPAAAVSQPQ
ncbi:MAG: hypothetical protein WCT12_06855 [Verrucomicrobiota bacterium]